MPVLLDVFVTDKQADGKDTGNVTLVTPEAYPPCLQAKSKERNPVFIGCVAAIVESCISDVINKVLAVISIVLHSKTGEVCAKSYRKAYPSAICYGSVSTLYKCIPPTLHNPRFYRILQKSHLPFTRTFRKNLGNTSVSRFIQSPPPIYHSPSYQSVTG